MSNCEQPKRDPRALNAYRHGLTGQIHIATPAEQAAYLRHCQGTHASLVPAGAFETDLVQSIADDRWRLKRAVAIESALFAAEVAKTAANPDAHEEGTAALAHAQAWLSQGKNLALLSLYESRIQRRVERNLQLVRESQAARRAALEQAAHEAQLLAQFAADKGETYDIERDFPPEALPPQFVFSTSEIALLAAHYARLAEAQKPVPATPRPLRKAA